MRPLHALALVVTLTACAAPASDAPHAGHDLPTWSPWSAGTFERAKRERRPIYVNVAAGWCHWCHVMDERTLGDPEVRALLDERYVAIRVDADARPDLADRYQAWGWPANAVLTPDARAVAELRGYQPKGDFLRLLRQVADDVAAGKDPGRPAPGPRPPVAGDLGPQLQAALAKARAQLDETWDEEAAGWGRQQKYPLAAPLEHALVRAALRPGDAVWRARALRTLDAQRALLDPVDGGLFQYSTDGTWGGARHFEKIVSVNAGALEAWSIAARATGDDRLLEPAREVARWVLGPLRRDGAFGASQDADPPASTGDAYYALDMAGRRAVAPPRVDPHVYADLNGWTAVGLLRLHAATGDPELLAAAERSLQALFTSHSPPPKGAGAGPRPRGQQDGPLGLLHAADDPPEGVRHLADQVGPATACLLLFEATGDADWSVRVWRLAHAILALEDPAGGFFAHTPDPALSAVGGVFAARRKPLRENALAARLLLHLEALTDDPKWGVAARRALLAVTPDAPDQGRLIGELVLALEEASLEPLKLAVVAREGDPAAVPLLAAARRVWAPRVAVHPQPPGGDSDYPDLGKPAIFLCGGGACSLPVTAPAELPSALAEFAASVRSSPGSR